MVKLLYMGPSKLPNTPLLGPKPVDPQKGALELALRGPSRDLLGKGLVA